MSFPPWPVQQIETEKRRLVVLQYLDAAQGYEAAASILLRHCSRVGVPTNADQITACLAWLLEQDLIALRAWRGEPIARLTHHGREIVEGTRIIPGVLRPDP